MSDPHRSANVPTIVTTSTTNATAADAADDAASGTAITAATSPPTSPPSDTTYTTASSTSTYQDALAAPAPAIVVPPTVPSSHGRRGSTLGSAAADMLQVPSAQQQLDQQRQSPLTEEHQQQSSPTLSAYSDRSAALPQRSAALLRDNDPNHMRNSSVNTAFTDAPSDAPSEAGAGAGAGVGAAPDAGPSSPSSAAPHTSEKAQLKARDDCAQDDVEDAEANAEKPSPDSAPSSAPVATSAAPRSLGTRIREALFGKSKAARAAAVTAAIEAEKERQRNIDPAPFRFRPYALGELVDPKSVDKLKQLGGTKALLAGLGTDGERGLDLPVHGSQPDASTEADLEAGRAAATPMPPAYNQGKGSSGGKDEREEDASPVVSASLADRERVFGRNVLPIKKAKSLLLLMWLALQDKILIILIIAAIVSLALGFYTDFGAPPEYIPCDNPPPGQEACEAPDVDWVEGLAILVAVAVVVSVGSINDYGKERQLQALNAQKEERDVKVIRQGRPALMSVHDVQVGDVLHIEPGEVIPADGVFLRGHNVKCDESSATGESDLIKKATYDECLADADAAAKTGSKPSKRDPFLISGARVQEGVGEYVVTAVGPMSFNGKLMASLHTEAEDTPLQAKLNALAAVIAKLGSAAGLLLFIVLFIKFLAQLKGFEGTANDKGQRFISVLILAVTVVVVAIPEGLPLAVTLALAFATRRMAKQNLLVRLLGSCETMGAATVVCTDKTGTLTQNQMTVVAGSAGIHCKFVRHLEDHMDRAIDDEAKKRASADRKDWAIDQSQLGDVLKGPLRELWNDSIAINSTAFEESDSDRQDAVTTKAKSLRANIAALLSSSSSSSKKKKAAIKADASAKGGFVGSKTETALLSLAKELGWPDYRVRRKVNETVMSYPFSSERKAMAVVVKKADGTGYRLFVKGASEVISQLCDSVVEVPHADDASEAAVVATAPITEEDRTNVQRTIMFYANQSLRTLSLAYKDFASWPPPGAKFVENEQGSGDAAGPKEVDYKSLAQGLTLLSIVAIEDPLREGVAQAVRDAHTAGVRVVMCTGDNSLTARSIAAQCGIYNAADSPVIMEGPVFRALNDVQVREVVPRLAVLARSSPQDKQKLVETLKSMGEIVAVTGDGTNDAAALKSANIGFSMGIAGTEVAKEASDIILLDDRFSSIVTALLWGRCVRDAVSKFLQFQLAVNVGAVIITFVTSVASDDEESALTAVQLLWLNLIMDTLAALALATDPASPALLKRPPKKPNAPLITLDMWKMIIGQSIYQVILVLVLNFAGSSILGLDDPNLDPFESRHNHTIVSALTFNCFVWCQLFNQVNARRLDRKVNIFEGLFRNGWFLAIMAIEIGAQILIIFVGGAAFSVTRLEGKHWAISIVAGSISWPIAVLIKLIPTDPIERWLVTYGLMADPQQLPFDAPDAYETREKLEKANWTEPRLRDLAEELELYHFTRSTGKGGGADGARRGSRLGFLRYGWRRPVKTIREQHEYAKARKARKAGIELAKRKQREAADARSHANAGAGAARAGGLGSAPIVHDSAPAHTGHSPQTTLHGSSGSKDRGDRERDDLASRFGALMPGITAAAIAGAWRPQNPPDASLADPAGGGEPSPSTWHLVRRGTNLRDEEAA